MSAYATVGGVGRQPRRSGLKRPSADFTLPLLDGTTSRPDPTARPVRHRHRTGRHRRRPPRARGRRQRARERRARSPAIDARVGGVLRRAAGEERFRGKLGQTLVVHVRDSARSGSRSSASARGPDPTGQALRVAAGAAARIAAAVGARRVAFAWTSAAAGSDARACEIAAEGALARQLPLRQVPDRRAEPPRPADALHRCARPVPSAADDGDRAFARARSTARAVARARDLVNEPAGTLTPTALAETAAGLGARRRALRRGPRSRRLRRARHGPLPRRRAGQHAGAALHSPRLDAAGRATRVVIVGKGVTFDSGGLSLKTNEGMLDMKTDMAGAAAVLAAAAAVATRSCPSRCTRSPPAPRTCRRAPRTSSAT